MGSLHAIDLLNAVPEYPDALDYLHDILQWVHGRSGVTPSGSIMVLSWTTLLHYQSSTGNRLSEAEQLALIELDGALIADGAERDRITEEKKKHASNSPPDPDDG